MSPTRVLQIITRLIVGGAQETVMYTAERLDPTLFQVQILSGPQTGSEGSLIDEVRQRGIPLTILPELVREVNPVKDLIALWKIYRFLRSNNYEVVHTHSSKAGILGRIAARLAGVPVIVHTIHGWSFHDYMPAMKRWGYIWLERFCATLSDALIVVSAQDIPKGIKAHIGKATQYHLIRSAIPLDEFDPGQYDRKSIRLELGLPADAPVVGNVGRFSPQKNPLDWVKIAGRIARALPECRFLLVGDGPLRSQVEASLKDEGLTSRSVLTGLRHDPARMMAAMDVFLLSSLWEGLPRVIPQAMLMGLPLVATQVDGSSEAIQDGITGFICSPSDLDQLAQRCLALLQSPSLRSEIGRAARSYAQEEFSLDCMLDLIDRLYINLLQSGR